MSTEGKWYTNVYVIVTAFISFTAVAMAALLFLLLPQSSEIIRIMQWRMMNLRTFGIELDASYQGWREWKDDLNATHKEQEDLILSAKGWVDRTEPDKARLKQAVGLTVGSGEAADEFVGEYRKVGDTDYLKLQQAPDSFGGLSLVHLKDRWLRLDLGRIRRSIDLPLFGGGQDIGEAEKAYLIEQFRLTPFLQFERRLKDETIGDKRTHHYKIRSEVLFIKDFYLTLETLRLGRDLTREERLAIDTFFANVTSEPGEIWIGHNDYYLYRLRLRFRYDDGSRSGIFALTAAFSDFNRPLAIGPPRETAEDIHEFIRSLLPGITQHLPLAAAGEGNRVIREEEAAGGLPVYVSFLAEEDPDGDGLSNALESFYLSDPHNPDTDGDGMNDGDEVTAGLNPTGPGRLFDFNITSDE